MIAESKTLGNYLATFAEFGKRVSGQPAWLQTIRHEAFARFCETGFPSTKDEDWRFTNVAPIADTAFELAGHDGSKVTLRDLEPYLLPGSICQLVFVNGCFVPGLSRFDSLPNAVTVSSLSQELTNGAEALEPHLAHYADVRRDAFCALNTAFIEDGAYVHVPRGTVLETPIYLLFISVPTDQASMAHPRSLIVVEEESEATVVEDYGSLGSGAFFSNVVTELIAGEGAIVSHYRIQREDTQSFNVSTLRVQQERSANVSSHSVLLGGALVRNNVHPVLAGEGGDCLINGLFIAAGRQHMDNYMLVEHASPHCGSRQFYNGVLDGRSRGVFHGRIVVHKDAQKTDAKQTNRNLLLSDEAQIDTKPQLEIHADDVKCTHGATIGQVEEDALFYARSRGIDERSARHLLLFAFASECLERMRPIVVRDYVTGVVQGRLPEGAPSTAPSLGLERAWEEVG